MIKYARNFQTTLTKISTYNTSAFTEQEFEKSEKYVLDTLRSRNWIDFMISSYLPKQVRTAYCAIQLFNHQTIRISDNIREPSLGLGKLQFWRETINKIYRSEKPNAEPISICLHRACHNHPLTKGYFDRIINSRAEQLNTRNIESMEQMLKLSQNTYSTNIALILELLRIEIEEEHEDLITKMGHSIGVCAYLQRVPYGLRNYRFLVPHDILAKYNVDTSNIWDRIHGKPSEDFYDAVLEIAAFSKKSFQESVQIYQGLVNKKKIHPHAFRAFLKGIEVEDYLTRLQFYNFNLFEPGLNKGNYKLPFSFWKAARNHRFYVKGKIE